MWKRISFLQRNLTYSIPLLMVLGVFYGFFFEAGGLKVLIIPLTFLMVYPMMVNLQIGKVFSGVDFKLQALTQFINFGIIPFIGYALGLLFFSDQPLIVLGILLASLLPTSGMTISWTGFAKGNMNAAIKMTVIGLVLGSLLTPLYAKLLMGKVIDIPLLTVFKQIAVVVFLPMLAGYLTQRFVIWKYGEAKYHKDIKKKFPMLSTLGVLGIVFVAMALKAGMIVSEPYILLQMLIPIAILYAINFILSTLAGKYLFDRGDGIALVYGTVMRNLSIALAIAMTAFGEQGSDIALIVAIAYIIQVQAAAWYVRYTSRIFGPSEDKVEHVMQEGIFSLPPDASLKDAIQLLDEEHIHSVAVADGQDIKGILTSETIVNQLAENPHLDVRIGDVRLLPVVQCPVQSPLEKAIKSMKRKHNYKCIVTEKGKPVGVFTESDILRHAR